jgi:hypothetical protein
LEQFERHAFLIKELLNIYVTFPLELSRFLFSDTWTFLQQTMLDTTHEMLNSTSPFALDSVAPTNNVADTMLQVRFQRVFPVVPVHAGMTWILTRSVM